MSIDSSHDCNNDTTTEFNPTRINSISPQAALNSLGIVVGNVTHDFNNILSLIFGYVEMALLELPEGHAAKADLEQVLAAGDKSNDVISKLLTLHPRASLKRSDINIIQSINTALKRLKNHTPSNINVDVSISDELQNTVISAHTIEIQQIITNIYTNSLQAMPSHGGNIVVTVEMYSASTASRHQPLETNHNCYAKIIINDDGRGMDPSTVDNIYVPFFSANDTDQPRAGLGLSSVHNIVESLQGKIYASSRLTQGSTFEIYLPLLDLA